MSKEINSLVKSQTVFPVHKSKIKTLTAAKKQSKPDMSDKQYAL